MEISFSSQEELFKRVRPALKTKVQELKRLNYQGINEFDIWDYLSKTKWIYSNNLTLSDIVSDILHLDNKLIFDYVKKIKEV